MNKKLCAVLIAGLLSASAHAFEPFAIRDIRVEGIQRTEAGTVFSYLPVKVGDTLTGEKASQSIKALFATGFFKDVRVEVEGDVMVLILQERPAIAKIDFVGMKEFEKDQILKAMKDMGLSETQIFDRALLDRAEQELKRQYLTKGKYGVQITTTVTPLERNRVGINFNITEGESAKIKAINIVGVQAFKEKDLLELFELSTPGWLSWYTKNDQYSRQKLSADLEKLRSYYMNRGYLEFAVDSTQVSISPDKQDIYITVNISEGDRYQISSIKLAGDLILPEDEIRKLVPLKPGQVFSREELNNTTKRITDRLSDQGYAFANVNASPELDKEKKQVAFTIFVDPGKRVYVRRINVTGNTRTRDEVIRREMRQMEGGWYNAEQVTLSKQRVDKLGYFADVTVETPPVPGTADQVDVNLNVTEKPTGNIMLGAGFSQSEKVMLSGSISQNNIFGSGKHLTLGLNTSKTNRNLSLSYTDPYFTIDGISQGFDVYHRTYEPTTIDVGDYKTASTGAGIRFGFPISERESIGVGLTLDHTKITTYDSSPQRYIDFVNNYGSSNITIPLTVNWTSDGKDSYIFPTTGTYQRAGLELALPGGDLKYWKLSYQYQRFFPVSKSLTLMVNGDFGYGDGYGGQDGLPFYKNYYVGGINSVRGYAASSLGPVDAKYKDERLGGNRKIVGNAELLWGLPGYDKSLRMGLFFDIGQTFGPGQKIKTDDFRASTGVSLAWISPVGPLKFSIAAPLNDKPGDDTETFQFQLGSTF
ncbi:outer membrane protein assembly factor BamA [Azovibrio restrictus]|uniref:outer membrane protein assembly factor BamA n=1 Tax=Azovibrio restrictus TaxID=146938 RepID=UPI0026F24E73|nr:outer membrane protein assembly factor BamA [Azovibrio restrictus]MDD3483719.1 outer membrane protein assembly factor BamA [Azovibrio restrictus]